MEKPKRVFTVAPMPSEKCAYALARYSRSPDSIRQSIEWVRTHNSQSFLESFYFQYGHASIADLGHVVVCFEGMSELAATEIEDENSVGRPGQVVALSGFFRAPVSSRRRSFRTRRARRATAEAARALLEAYRVVNARAFEYLTSLLPRPEEMKPEAYKRNLAARAFDVARYLLFWGIPTNIGQVTSIRTLERQIRRLKASEYEELRSLGDEIGEACAREPDCVSGARTRRRSRSPQLWRVTPKWTRIWCSRAAICGSGRDRICPAGHGATPNRWILSGPPRPPPISSPRCSIR